MAVGKVGVMYIKCFCYECMNKYTQIQGSSLFLSGDQTLVIQ